MSVRIAVSEARKKLSDMLKDVSLNPDRVYEITVNDMVLGELRTPASNALGRGGGRALLKAAERTARIQRPGGRKKNVARDHDEYLYPSRPGRERRP